MRPLRLELEGFTVYRKPQTIDFEKLNFFVIQGRTGAGKTSIVDAITYALYGKVPRYGDAKATKHVISKGSSSMRVALDFSVGGKRYRIERFYSPRLKEDQARAYEDGRRLNLSKPQIEKWVREITGLDYRTFTRVILLPQGEFDRFLKPKQPKERREILINLLDLEIFEKMRQIASETYREKEGELRTLREELSRLRDVSEDTLLELERKERETEERVKEIDREVSRVREEISILKELHRLEREIEEARRERDTVLKEILKKSEEVKQARVRAEEADREAERIPQLRELLEAVLKELERVEGAVREIEDVRKKEERLRHIEETLNTRTEDLKDREERMERGRELIGRIQEELERIDFDEDRFTEVLRDLERKKNLETKMKRLESVRKDIQTIEARLEDMVRKVKDLEDAITLKEGELKKKVIHLYAQRIREALDKGDKCPVCGGTFAGF
ncbi:MAG: AAA family ATPase [Aquificota bacterium]|nr:AAA family ATPase [Aquificota bacterium]